MSDKSNPEDAPLPNLLHLHPDDSDGEADDQGDEPVRGPETFDFGIALRLLRQGGMVRRLSWEPGVFLVVGYPEALVPYRSQDGQEGFAPLRQILPNIVAVTPPNGFRILGPSLMMVAHGIIDTNWLLQCDDLFAQDWGAYR